MHANISWGALPAAAAEAAAAAANSSGIAGGGTGALYSNLIMIPIQNSTSTGSFLVDIHRICVSADSTLYAKTRLNEPSRDICDDNSAADASKRLHHIFLLPHSCVRHKSRHTLLNLVLAKIDFVVVKTRRTLIKVCMVPL
jgi:hypothetical protein